VTDPNNVEPEDALIARARAIHTDVTFGEGFESRFRKGATKTEVQSSPSPAQQAAEQKERTAASSTATAKLPTPAPAAPVVARAATVERSAGPATGKVAVVETPKPPRVPKQFSGELAGGFDEVLERVVKKRRFDQGFRAATVALQPVLGALSDHAKRELERAVGNPLVFSRAGATGLNILVNFLLYPVAFMALAVALYGAGVVFSQNINGFILLGVFVAFLESVYRLRDGIFKARQPVEMHCHGASYGILLAGIAEFLRGKYQGVLRIQPIPVDGFYGNGFVEKLERERRYGNVYSLQDWGESYYLQLEFPRKVPEMGPPINEKLPAEMPDYDYDLVLRNGTFVVRGRCTDEKIRSVSSSLGAFPPEFTTIVQLHDKVKGFSHRYNNKLLEVLLLKEKSGLVEQ
jgi:hypothetical protein